MLFRKKVPRSCGYCTYGTKMDNETVLCVKRGVVSLNKNCGKFSYDPCKRVPARPKSLDFVKYNDQDFSL